VEDLNSEQFQSSFEVYRNIYKPFLKIVIISLVRAKGAETAYAIQDDRLSIPLIGNNYITTVH
jgi:hypothetical protein